MIPVEFENTVRSIQQIARDRGFSPNLVTKAMTDLEKIAARNYLVPYPGIRTLLTQAVKDYDFALRTMGDRIKNMSVVITYLNKGAEKVEKAYRAYAAEEGQDSASIEASPLAGKFGSPVPTPQEIGNKRRRGVAVKADDRLMEQLDYVHWLINDQIPQALRSHKWFGDDRGSVESNLAAAGSLVQSLFGQKEALEPSQQSALFKLLGKLKNLKGILDQYSAASNVLVDLDGQRNQVNADITAIRKQRNKHPLSDKDHELRDQQTVLEQRSEKLMNDWQSALQARVVVRKAFENVLSQASGDAGRIMFEKKDWQDNPAGVNMLKIALNEFRLLVSQAKRTSPDDSRALLTVGRQLAQTLTNIQTEQDRTSMVLPDDVEADIASLYASMFDNLNVLIKSPNHRPEMLQKIANSEGDIQNIINRISQFQRGREKAAGIPPMPYPPVATRQIESSSSMPFGIVAVSIPRDQAPPGLDRNGIAAVSRRPAQFDTAGRVGWEVWLNFKDEPKKVYIVGRVGKGWNDYRQALWWIKQTYPVVSPANTLTFGTEVAQMNNENSGRPVPTFVRALPEPMRSQLLYGSFKQFQPQAQATQPPPQGQEVPLPPELQQAISLIEDNPHAITGWWVDNKEKDTVNGQEEVMDIEIMLNQSKLPRRQNDQPQPQPVKDITGNNFSKDWVDLANQLPPVITFMQSGLQGEQWVFDVKNWDERFYEKVYIPLQDAYEHYNRMLYIYGEHPVQNHGMTNRAYQQLSKAAFYLGGAIRAASYVFELLEKLHNLQRREPNMEKGIPAGSLLPRYLDQVLNDTLDTQKLLRQVYTRSLPPQLMDAVDLADQNPEALVGWEVEQGRHEWGEDQPQDIIEVEMLLDRSQLPDDEGQKLGAIPRGAFTKSVGRRSPLR